MVYTVDLVCAVDTVDTVYTIETALHCLNRSMHSLYMYLLFGNVRTLLEVAIELLSKKSGERMGDTP